MKLRVPLCILVVALVFTPVVLAKWIAIEGTKLTAPVPAIGDLFGRAVALSGDTAVVGTPRDGGGQAHVYVRSGGAWSLQATLLPEAPWFKDAFGWSVAIEEDTILVGAASAGDAYVFTRSGSSWTQQARLTGSSSGALDRFGLSVALDGDTAVVGAPGQSQAPQPPALTYVFVRAAGVWTEQAQLGSGWAVRGFGTALALEGERVVVGSPEENRTHVFSRSGTAWTFDQALQGRGPVSPVDEFGFSVALSGSTLMVGAPEGTNGISFNLYAAGRVNVYEHDGTKWRWETGLTAKKPFFGEGLGSALALDGDVAVVGANGGSTGGDPKSSTYVFVRSGTSWSQQGKLKPADLQNNDAFGAAVALSGSTLLGGAPGFDHPVLGKLGAAYFYDISQPGPVNYCQPGISASGCAASISAVGTPSASATSGFQLVATNVEGGRAGLFLYTSFGRELSPWGNGTSLMCIASPAHQSVVMPGVGTQGACDGAFTLDLNAVWCPTCPKPTHNPGEGSGVQAQLWYRDPLSTSNQTTSFSDAVEFWLEP